MKQIFIGIIVAFFFVSLALGVLCAVIDLFMNNYEMTGEAAAVILAVFFLVAVSPILLDFLESWLD